MRLIHNVNTGLIEPALASIQKVKTENPITRQERTAAWRATLEDPQLAKEWAANRVEKVNLTILPDLVASEMFQMIPLEDDQNIELDTTYNAEYEVKTINQFGGMTQNQWALKDAAAVYYPYEIETDRVMYPIRSIRQGNIDKSDEVNRDLEFAYRNMIDKDAWTLFTSIFTDAFTSNTVYRLHSRVVSGNVPTTNIVDASAQGALTVKAIKQLLAHCKMAGIVPRLIYMSVQDITDMWDWTPVVAGYTGGDFVEAKNVLSQEKFGELMRSGKIDNLFGYPIIFKTLNHLSSGTLYVVTDKPAGQLYYKPGFERTKFWTEDECDKLFDMKYHQAVRMEGVIKPMVPEWFYLNSVRVDIA